LTKTVTTFSDSRFPWLDFGGYASLFAPLDSSGHRDIYDFMRFSQPTPADFLSKETG